MERQEKKTKLRNLYHKKDNYLIRHPPLEVGDDTYYKTSEIFVINHDISSTIDQIRELEDKLKSLKYSVCFPIGMIF